MTTTRICTIDLIKGLATLFVVLQHTVDRSLLVAILSPSWLLLLNLPNITISSLTLLAFNDIINLTIDQAVPLFLILMGTNGLISGRGPRILRLIIPFIIIFCISLAIGIYRGEYYLGFKTLLFQLPVSGPGNYFIPLAVSFAIMGKWIVKAFRKWPKETIITAFLVNLLFDIFSSSWAFYSICILRCIFAIVLGMYIYEYGFNKYTLIISLISIASILTVREWNALTFFYPAVLVAMALKYSPKHPMVEIIGKASYHIFLVQMLYFGSGIAMTRSINSGIFIIIGILVDTVVPIALGLIFWSATNVSFKRLNATPA